VDKVLEGEAPKPLHPDLVLPRPVIYIFVALNRRPNQEHRLFMPKRTFQPNGAAIQDRTDFAPRMKTKGGQKVLSAVAPSAQAGLRKPGFRE